MSNRTIVNNRTEMVFTYGMLTDSVLMNLHCDNPEFVGTGFLENFELYFNGHADLRLCVNQEPKSKVFGTLWLITPNDLNTLDQIEGVPHYYRRDQHWISGPMDTLWNCWVYIQNFDTFENKSVGKRYLNIMRNGYNQSGLPLSQINSALADVEIISNMPESA